MCWWFFLPAMVTVCVSSRVTHSKVDMLRANTGVDFGRYYTMIALGFVSL